jgi:uncharacterized protein YprB with RNaseH-like and TPR domain
MQTLILDLETIGFDADNADALSPYKGQIVSLGLYDRTRELGSVYFVAKPETNEFSDDSFKFQPHTERELLEDFWETAKNYDVLVSFNGRAFDVPFLYIRSMALGVRPSVDIARQRYVTKQSLPYHVDLFDEFSFHGAVTKKPSLEALCQAVGIDNPKQAMTGADVTEAFLEKDVVSIAKYNAGDVVAISKLYEMWLENLAPKSFLNTLEM